MVEYSGMQGYIAKVEFQWDGHIDPMGVNMDKAAQHCKLYVSVKNNWTKAMRLGILIEVERWEDHVIILKWQEWESWPYTGAGVTHKFNTDLFAIKKPGTYWVRIVAYQYPYTTYALDARYEVLAYLSPQYVEPPPPWEPPPEEPPPWEPPPWEPPPEEPPEEPPAPEREIPWVWVGLAVLGIAMLSAPREKPKAKKK